MHKHLTYLIILLVGFNSIYLNAQIHITGIVQNKDNNPIENANVVVLNARNNIISYTYTKPNGSYNINFELKDYEFILLSVNSLGYDKKTDTLYLHTNKNIYNKSFTLIENITQLNEVVLKPYEKISKEGNVTTYKVSAFKNDSEETVEDLLKRIPGIEVLKNGTIKAHGRFIDKLLIEGEDMFDKNYTMLSKNLDSKVLDAVQILDEFEDNPILAKVLKSDKVAINLKLKQQYKNIWFGNVGIGAGTKERVELISNLGLIRKDIKFFNFIKYTNLGEKAAAQLNTVSTSSSNNLFNETYTEPTIEPIFVIHENELNNFDEGQSTFNNAFSDALSFVKAINKSLKIRGTGYFLHDNQVIISASKTTFNTNTPAIEYFEYKNTNIKDNLAGGELELKYSVGENSYLKNVTKYNSNPTKIRNNLLFNDEELSENLNKKEFSLYNHLNHSLLINNKNLLHTYLYFGKNHVKQKAKINYPIAIDIFNTNGNTNANNISYDNAAFIGGKSTLLLKNNKFSNSIQVSYENLKEERENFFAIENTTNTIQIDSLQNDLTYKQNKFKLKTNVEYKISKNVSLTGRLSLDYINIDVYNTKEHTWLLNPSIWLRLKNLRIGYFSFGYNRDYEEPKSSLFLANYQLQSFNSFLKGQNNIRFPIRNKFNMFYELSNNMKTKTISLKTQYITSNGRYTTVDNIFPNFILSTYDFVNNGNTLTTGFNITSYFKKLHLSTNIGTSQTWTNNPIKANTTQFKNLKTYFASYYITGTTYFNIPVNLTFKFVLNKSASNFNNIQSITSWSTTHLNFNYKISKHWMATLENSFYNMQNDNYLFSNFNLNFTPEKSKFSYQLIFKNILNENEFSITDIYDYSTYEFNTQLLPRYIFALLKYRF
jgi:hypothetical protein